MDRQDVSRDGRVAACVGGAVRRDRSRAGGDRVRGDAAYPVAGRGGSGDPEEAALVAVSRGGVYP